MKTKRFAAETEVSVEKTRAELEALLSRHGATQRATYTDEEAGRSVIRFRISGRMVQLQVRQPRREDVEPRSLQGISDLESYIRRKIEQGERSAWRRLLLVVRAKLELIADSGSTVEREFLADILLADGKTVHEWIEPQLEDCYKSGRMPPLLGAGT